jgi:hypothetical protein
MPVAPAFMAILRCRHRIADTRVDRASALQVWWWV